jgi:hypothetical protein
MGELLVCDVIALGIPVLVLVIPLMISVVRRLNETYFDPDWRRSRRNPFEDHPGWDTIKEKFASRERERRLVERLPNKPDSASWPSRDSPRDPQ